MRLDRNQQAFFALLRAGLWEQEARLEPFGEVDHEVVLKLAEEQSVVGLITAGIEHVSDKKPQKKNMLQFVGRTVQLEQRNQAMNGFIGALMEKMNEVGIYSVLVKGQGVARCYERPLWRSCGDVDLLIANADYSKAKKYLLPLATSLDEEDQERSHLGMTINHWVVELHGTLHTRQMPKVNRVLDEVQDNVFARGKVRIWKNGRTDVYLPAPNEDVFFVFSHIVQHYFGGGIGLRQICDWCRLLWTYRELLKYELIEEWIARAGLQTEWKVFAALAVEWLGMPKDNMPSYSKSRKWSRKAKLVIAYVLETGNFGHNRNNTFRQKSLFVRSAVSLWRYTFDTIRSLVVFPIDSSVVWWRMVIRGIKKTLIAR